MDIKRIIYNLLDFFFDYIIPVAFMLAVLLTIGSLVILFIGGIVFLFIFFPILMGLVALH